MSVKQVFGQFARLSISEVTMLDIAPLSVALCGLLGLVVVAFAILRIATVERAIVRGTTPHRRSDRFEDDRRRVTA